MEYLLHLKIYRVKVFILVLVQEVKVRDGLICAWSLMPYLLTPVSLDMPDKVRERCLNGYVIINGQVPSSFSPAVKYKDA